MRNIKITNWIMILLFIGTTLSIFHLRNHRWNYANLLGNNRESTKQAVRWTVDHYLRNDSTYVENVISMLTTNKINNQFLNYLKTQAIIDSTLHKDKIKINNIDGYSFINTQQVIKKDFLSDFLKKKIPTEFRGEAKNIANIEYQNRNFIIQLQPLPLVSYLNMVFFDMIVLFILLTLALNTNPKYQIYLRSMYFIYFFEILFYFLSLFSEYFRAFCLLSQLSEALINFVFILSIYKILARIHISIPLLLITALLMNLWFDILYITKSIYIISFFLIIFSERGVNRNIYLYYFTLFGVYFVSNIVLGGTAFTTMYRCLAEPLTEDILSDSFIIPIDSFDYYFYLLLNFTGYVFFIILILMISSRIFRLKTLIIEAFYLFSLKFYLTVLIFFEIIYYLFIFPSSKIPRTLALFFTILIVYIIINKYLKLFPFINPVRFNAKKMLIKLLNISYDYTDHNEYTQFFYEYLKKIQSKAKICIISENSFVGDEFPQLEYSRLKEVLSLNSQNKPYLNLDLELLDETEIGEQIEDFNNVKMPHLLYPIYNSKDELQAIVAFGKFPRIYWQKSLAEAIYKLVEVFSGFYLNILVHEKYLEQGKAIVKEQEEKLYNQKIAELKTQQNEELKAEKKLITESIEYAALIQKSLVPQPKELELTLTKYFVVWQQRDIVGGDLYWSETVPNSDEVLFSVIDCTGHGIPGALMSVTANSSLERITKEHKCYEVDLILNQMHQSIGTTLHQSEKNTQQDGMDMSVIKFDKKSKQLQFAGAQHNLILIKGNSQELIIIKGDRYSIGGLKWKNEIKFNAHELQLDRGDTIYLFSDGIVDQPYQHSKTKLRRLGTKAWHDFLVEKNQQSINKIKTEIEELIAEMREISTQRDDICIVGIRIE